MQVSFSPPFPLRYVAAKANHITGAAYGPNATNISINLLPIIIILSNVLYFRSFWHFLSHFPQVNREDVPKANYFLLKCQNLCMCRKFS